ncbi:MAG: hypothetical protein QOI78_7357, partial [Actinomycetota bacterium]|nr:hypothetical protein [Actinomycetota bacterium]
AGDQIRRVPDFRFLSQPPLGRGDPARLPSGTTITLVEAIRNACAAGIGCPGRDIGLLRPGDRADVLVLDDSLSLRDVLLEAGSAGP